MNLLKDLTEFSSCKEVVKGIDIVFNVGVKGSTASQRPNDYFYTDVTIQYQHGKRRDLRVLNGMCIQVQLGYILRDYFFEDEVWKTFHPQMIRFGVGKEW